MSFNKRILKKENIINNVDNIMTYLGKPDAVFVNDSFSDDVYRMFSEGVTEEDLKVYVVADIVVAVKPVIFCNISSLVIPLELPVGSSVVSLTSTT